MSEINTKYKTKLFTGIRPTGNLTIANYLGAVEPIIKLQKEGLKPLVFIADIHAITDSEPEIVQKNIEEVVADYIALGIDPNKANIYLQSDIAGEVSIFSVLLARHITVSELLRVPTLKDKLKKGKNPETANALLLFYPVIMAADILLNKAENVPVGEDQLAHLEVTRELARSFNKKYGNILPIPKVLQMKSLRILSLKGEGKMSKTNPAGAIFLTDTPKDVEKKIKVAETAMEGKMSDNLESLIHIGKGLSKNDDQIKEIDEIIKAHLNKEPVMGKFKKLITQIVIEFLNEFQTKRSEIIKDKKYIESILEQGKKIALENARETLNETFKATKFK